MEVLWGIILLIVMYIVVPVAIIGGTLAMLGGRQRRNGRAEATERAER